MDKRTFTFVISLSLTLLSVNLLFDWYNQGNIRERIEQQKALKIEKRDALQEDLLKRRLNPDEIPQTPLFLDPSESQFASNGVAAGNALLTLPWTSTPPDTLFANGATFTLVYRPADETGPLVYGKTADQPLPIGNLPLIGAYELILLTPQTHAPNAPPSLTFATYTDGQFQVPVLSLIAMNKQLNQPEKSADLHTPGNSIVLLKTPKGYLPVGIYDAAERVFIQLEQIGGLRTEIASAETQPEAGLAEERYYVLENAYQQLVFSSKGGALAEINLPFQSSSDPESVVKEIGFDRDIAAAHPYDAYFPSHPYLTPGADPKGPYIEHSKGKTGGYYPLIRRDLKQKGNRKSTVVLPEFYAFNIVSQYPELAELNYKVTHFDAESIVFEAVQKNRKIIKTFSLNSDRKNAPYTFDLTVKVEGDSRGLWLTSGVPEVEIISNAPAPALKYRKTVAGKSVVEKINPPTEITNISDLYPDWICNSNGFLGVILDPLSQIDAGFRAQMVPGTLVPSRLVLVGEEHERFKPQDLPGYMVLLPLNAKGGTMKFRIFAGPFATNILEAVDKSYSNPETGYNPDYIASQSFHGWFSFISAPFSVVLLFLMNVFHTLTGSWGISIILLTVALRVMLYPLNAWSTKSMLKMQEIAPEVQRIQEKYKSDPQKAQLQIMNLYRERGVNPVSGCLPILFQMPFLIGMFDLLKTRFELRGASFIPGWIDNLAAPDVLFSWSTPVFFIGNEFHLLPILLGGVMFLQQRLMSPLPKDVNQMTEQQRQQRAMGSIMTVVFTVMFYHFPSGLNIYWLSSMILGILQQWWTQKTIKRATAATPQVEVIDPKKGKRK